MGLQLRACLLRGVCRRDILVGWGTVAGQLAPSTGFQVSAAPVKMNHFLIYLRRSDLALGLRFKYLFGKLERAQRPNCWVPTLTQIGQLGHRISFLPPSFFPTYFLCSLFQPSPFWSNLPSLCTVPGESFPLFESPLNLDIRINKTPNMLAFQQAGKAIKARSATAALVRALTAAPITHVQIQNRGIHDKIPVDHDAIKHGKPATEPGEDLSSQDSTSKATKPTIVTAAVVEKADSLSGDEFWRKVPIWKDVSLETFISYRWTVRWLSQILVHRMFTDRRLCLDCQHGPGQGQVLQVLVSCAPQPRPFACSWSHALPGRSYSGRSRRCRCRDHGHSNDVRLSMPIFWLLRAMDC